MICTFFILRIIFGRTCYGTTVMLLVDTNGLYLVERKIPKGMNGHSKESELDEMEPCLEALEHLCNKYEN